MTLHGITRVAGEVEGEALVNGTSGGRGSEVVTGRKEGDGVTRWNLR